MNAMKFLVFGKAGCARCQTTKSKLTHFVAKAGLEGQVAIEYHDLDMVKGMAEAAFHDVMSIPTTILLDGNERPMARWEGIPHAAEIQAFLGDAQQRPQSAAADQPAERPA